MVIVSMVPGTARATFGLPRGTRQTKDILYWVARAKASALPVKSRVALATCRLCAKHKKVQKYAGLKLQPD